MTTDAKTNPGTALPLTHKIYDALPRGQDGESLQAAIEEYGALCAAHALKNAPQPVPTLATPDLANLTKNIDKLRKVHSAATATISRQDPERRLAKNADLEGKPVPFTMYEVDWTSKVVRPVTITRFGINTAVGATAPSVDVTYADRRKASASANMFYMREEWAQAELSLTKAEAAREDAKGAFEKLAYKTMPSLLDAAQAFVEQGATNVALNETVQTQAAEIARLRAVVQEVNNWVVCSAIATPEDMAGNFEHIEKITNPDYAGDDSEFLFEVTCFGFDGGSDETDDRVLWVTAPSIEVVQAAVEGLGASVLHLGVDPDPDEVDQVDFSLPKDTVALQEKCQHFQVCDEEERLRRIKDLPNLRKSAGAAYTFLQVANDAITVASAVKGTVRWDRVESETIQLSVFHNGQKPADVEAVLLRHSPGAVGPGCRDDIAARIAAAEEKLREAALARDPSEPTI